MELLTRGSYGIESSYGDRDKLDSMGMENVLALAGDKTTALMMDASFSYYLQEAFRVDCGIEWQEDLTHKKNAYRLNL